MHAHGPITSCASLGSDAASRVRFCEERWCRWCFSSWQVIQPWLVIVTDFLSNRLTSLQTSLRNFQGLFALSNQILHPGTNVFWFFEVTQSSTLLFDFCWQTSFLLTVERRSFKTVELTSISTTSVNLSNWTLKLQLWFLNIPCLFRRHLSAQVQGGCNKKKKKNPSNVWFGSV